MNLPVYSFKTVAALALAGLAPSAAAQHAAPPSNPAFSTEKVLRGAGLISERREGRFVNYRVEAQGMAPLHEWLARYRAFWPSRIDGLKDLLKEMDQ